MNDTESAQDTEAPLDTIATTDAVARLIAGQRRAVDAVDAAAQALSEAVDAAARRLAASGRLAMVGAGASGRLCVQDGAELWPTFGWPAERLVLSIAGGRGALIDSVEGAEDDPVAAREEVASHAIGAEDVVLAVAASGRSPWTVAWLQAAREAGALTIGMASNARTPLLDGAEHPILLASGAEVLAGSTRLAAGTAQKAALNAFSTALMVRLNRTHDNLMVDMAAVNAKLDQRRIGMLLRIVPQADEQHASDALAAADGWVKLAVLLLRGDAIDVARERLARHAGSLRSALAELD